MGKTKFDGDHFLVKTPGDSKKIQEEEEIISLRKRTSRVMGRESGYLRNWCPHGQKEEELLP